MMIPAGLFGWIRVYSGVGQSAGSVLYWGRNAPAWDNRRGDCLQLFDAAGTRVSFYSLITNRCAELGLSSPTLQSIAVPLDHAAADVKPRP